jgi:Zn-dependent protease
MELLYIGASLVILIYSVILHEIAHGLVAERLGDPTARLMGRLTLNPRPHIDPIMTILVPLLLFIGQSPVIIGGAKPVVIDPFNLRDGRKDSALVSLAGPATNLALAIIFALILKFSAGFIIQAMGANANIVLAIILRAVQINLALFIFNLIPIPPLDGSKIFALILPEREANQYLAIGQFGIFIIFFLLMFPIAGFSLGDVMTSLIVFSEKLLGL